MSKLPKFGKTVDVEVLDKDGSTLSIETNYQHGEVRLPRYKHYEYRERVHDPREEMTHYLRFCEEKTGKLKSNFFTETNSLGDKEGWYYVVKCWTEAVR